MSNAKLLQAILNNQIDINALRRSAHPFRQSEAWSAREPASQTVATARPADMASVRFALGPPLSCGGEPYLRDPHSPLDSPQASRARGAGESQLRQRHFDASALVRDRCRPGVPTASGRSVMRVKLKPQPKASARCGLRDENHWLALRAGRDGARPF
jgi:hypothetical protein